LTAWVRRLLQRYGAIGNLSSARR